MSEAISSNSNSISNSSSTRRSLDEYKLIIKDAYSQNRDSVDLALCMVCLLFIIFGWFDLSIISSLYFLSLVYMTVRSVGSFYNQLPTEHANLQAKVDAMDPFYSKKMLAEFSMLATSWLVYSSLVSVDWVIQSVNSLVGIGLMFQPILRVWRFLLYVQYCKQFSKSLEPYCSESYSLEKTFVSDELAKSIPLSIHAKHMINIMSINNVFCYNLFTKANIKVLTVIDEYSSFGIDTISNILFRALEQASKAKPMLSAVMQNIFGHLTPLLKRSREHVVNFNKLNKPNKPISTINSVNPIR
jgi:hypothetical protein